jgi:type I restriction enzyme R subunit
MNDVGQIELKTQSRVIKLFQNRLGYEYLGDWQKRPDNNNVEEDYLRRWMGQRDYDEVLINKAIHKLKKTASIRSDELYHSNKNVYQMLRYGVSVRAAKGEKKEDVHFFDWENPENNHFGVAEEVSVRGKNNKRPDVVLYVNGIALGVLELKRAKVSIEKGIRQNLDNQSDNFIKSFFNTIQLLMAGNDSAGLRYGTIETVDKYYQEWKEPTDGI